MRAEEFDAIRENFDVVPLFEEMTADFITPVAAFAALSADGQEAFLFESVERGENVGRYSFVGFHARRSLSFDRATRDPASLLRFELAPLTVYGAEGLPPFHGGAVGFFGYGAAGWTERLPDTADDDIGVPDAKLLFFENVVVFDHVMQRLFVICSAFSWDTTATYESLSRRLSEAVQTLRQTAVTPLTIPASVEPATFRSNVTREEFESRVSAAKEEIAAGEIFQIVLSQRWETDLPMDDALTLYRVLRSINPSPYMFLLRMSECTLVGASPEMLVRVDGGYLQTRPIAGTRPRGMTRAHDIELEKGLLGDEKENAEHLMLVDLSRNDLGRVSDIGSVEVTAFRHVERYSHVMHLVTDVFGMLREDCTPVDAFLSCFPAGTVSGAPKIRAMELIDRFERTRRGPYAGAVAYIGFSGSIDSCITIRTIVLARGRAYVQAGAGIVYDSIPAREYEETLSKSAALREAISIVKGISGDAHHKDTEDTE